MTQQVGLFDAKTRLSELVEGVQRHGEEIVITRRGRPVARLVPIEPEESAVEDALALLTLARRASRPGTGTLRDLIDEGRR